MGSLIFLFENASFNLQKKHYNCGPESLGTRRDLFAVVKWLSSGELLNIHSFVWLRCHDMEYSSVKITQELYLATVTFFMLWGYRTSLDAMTCHCLHRWTTTPSTSSPFFFLWHSDFLDEVLLRTGRVRMHI